MDRWIFILLSTHVHWHSFHWSFVYWFTLSLEKLHLKHSLWSLIFIPRAHHSPALSRNHRDLCILSSSGSSSLARACCLSHGCSCQVGSCLQTRLLLPWVLLFRCIALHLPSLWAFQSMAQQPTSNTAIQAAAPGTSLRFYFLCLPVLQNLPSIHFLTPRCICSPLPSIVCACFGLVFGQGLPM